MPAEHISRPKVILWSRKKPVVRAAKLGMKGGCLVPGTLKLVWYMPETPNCDTMEGVQLAFHIASPLKVLSRKSCTRSEEHTSELQSRQYLVCRFLLEKKLYIPFPPITLLILYS